MHILHLPCKEEKTMEQWCCSFHYISRNVHCMLVWTYDYKKGTELLWNELLVCNDLTVCRVWMLHSIFLKWGSLQFRAHSLDDFLQEIWRFFFLAICKKFRIDQMKNSSHKKIFLDDFLWWNFLDKFEQVFINKIEETPNWWNQEKSSL
jgi:hypothetical protein